ncbi:MAG: Arginine--tRNA ligase [Gammaproteobacteria bacterium]|nr:Arginine--tRNA ligase [Gammaproteobacteria bacterium]
MKDTLHGIFADTLNRLRDQGVLPANTTIDVRFEQPRQKDHGDLATNVALTLAKSAGMPPRELAHSITEALPDTPLIRKVEIAGPGFINIFVAPAAQFDVVKRIRREGEHYGRCGLGEGRRVLIEFVSANPTGPLHVGHGRGAAYGDTLGRVLTAAGYDVEREYYVNDSGRQMDILALSIWLRYLQACGQSLAFPNLAYQGDYIKQIAAQLRQSDGDAFIRTLDETHLKQLGADNETSLDALIKWMRDLLGNADYQTVLGTGRSRLLDDIRSDLEEFGVSFDRWLSEQSLRDSGALERTIKRLQQSGHTYEKDGALWFRSSDFGDEKDRVVVRESGMPTYFAPDIAYHLNKFDRGYDLMIDVLGADHHGYIPRVKASVQACGYESSRLHVKFVQFAVLYRGGKKISMSTRRGEFVTLRELREEVGADAARFFYVQRKPDQHLDFDLDLAKSQSNDNPVYYVQYAHARICSVFEQARDRGMEARVPDDAALEVLGEEHELDLAKLLTRYPDVVANAARNFDPHQIVYYLRELANGLHTYYNAHRFLESNIERRNARLALIDATRQVLFNGLSMIGVSSPSSM